MGKSRRHAGRNELTGPDHRPAWMRYRGKIVGGVVGMMIAGPIGLVVGVLIGGKWDKKHARKALAARWSDEGVAAAVVVLAAKLAKADDLVTADEVAVFRRLLNVPPASVDRVAALWREARETPSGYEPYARHLAQVYGRDQDMLKRILNMLRAVAEADQIITPGERWMIEDIARIFGLGTDWGAVTVEPLPYTHLDEAARGLFGGGGMDEPHLGLGQNLATRIESLGRQLLLRPWLRPLVAIGSGLGTAMMVAVSDIAVGLFAFSEPALATLAGAIVAVGAQTALPRPPGANDEIFEAARAAHLDPEEVLRAIAECEAAIKRVEAAAAPLTGPVANKAKAICALGRQIVEEMRSDPRDVARSKPFLAHYLEATLDVVRRWADLKSKAPSGGRAASVLAKLEPLLDDIEGLFQKHYDHAVADDALELDVTIESLQRMIKSETQNARQEKP
ncbi:MAG: 5-bromo-4-chloroindolyl phosphate hydrolysis family protein [Alphaproteobacteria bacterium]|nr:5-bromo-4-chloroindolyl phosphate hydrolysis family protein [Alphaproteobacteria bacterium]